MAINCFKMTEKLEKIVTQAIKTFSSVREHSSNLLEDSNWKSLVSLVNELTFFDIKLPARLFSRSDNILRSQNPVEYLSVYEDKSVVVGVFIIRQGAKIPLHDHSNMYGLLKVLQGKLKITSYNFLQSEFKDGQPSSRLFFNKPLNVVKNPVVNVTPMDNSCILTPTSQNVHEVTCLNGPAAFLDILSPPYDDDQSDSAPRACHYFREEERNGFVQLVQIPCSEDYWTNQD